MLIVGVSGTAVGINVTGINGPTSETEPSASPRRESGGRQPLDPSVERDRDPATVVMTATTSPQLRLG